MLTHLHSLNSGEWSPLVIGRTDFPKYVQACEVLENMHCLPTGGVQARPGSRYVGELKAECRLFRFSFSTETNFIIEMGAGYARFWSNQIQANVSSVSAWVTATAYEIGDQVSRSGINYVSLQKHTSSSTDEPAIGANQADFWHALTGTILEVPVPFLATELDEVQFLQVKDVVYFTHRNHSPYKLTRLADTKWAGQSVEFLTWPYQDENTDLDHTLTANATTGSVTLTSTNDVFDAGHVGSRWRVSHRRDENQSEVEKEITATGASGSIVGRGEYKFKTTGTWSATIEIEQSLDDGSSWETVRIYKAKEDRNYDITLSIDKTSLLRLNVTTYTTHTASPNPVARLEFKDAYIHGVVKINLITDAKNATGTVETELHKTTATTYWSEAAWSDKAGYPGTLALHESRIYFAGSDDQPLTFWGSVINDFENFTTGTSADDAIAFTIASATDNRIAWMASYRRSLFVGTNGGEFVAASRAESEIISSTNISVKPESNYGSQRIGALLLNDSLLFVRRLGRELRDLTYSFDRDGFTGIDISVLSEHLLRDGIKQLAFSQIPHPMVWAITEDADGVRSLISMMYSRDQDVIGWNKHTTPNGVIESVAVVPGDEADEVHIAVKRTIDGAAVRYIEVIDPETYNHVYYARVEDTLQLDCGKRYTFGSDTSSVTGLDHLEGQTVSVLVDGATQPDVTVSGGEITLTNAGQKVSVGLPYTPLVAPMPLVTPFDSGSSFTRVGHVARITITVDRTIGLRYTTRGHDAADNLWYEVPFRSTTDPTDTHPPVFTGEIDVTADGDYSRRPRVAFRQDQAQPFTILSIAVEWTPTETSL